MRTKNELLQLMLDNMHLFETGLCLLALRLTIRRIINSDEESFLLKFIQENRPNDLDFYWLPGLIEPRIEWIKEQMKN